MYTVSYKRICGGRRNYNYHLRSQQPPAGSYACAAADTLFVDCSIFFTTSLTPADDSSESVS